MNQASILGVFVICKFYQKDFKLFKRHSWRQKEKLNHQFNESKIETTMLKVKLTMVQLFGRTMKSLIRITQYTFVAKYVVNLIVNQSNMNNSS